MTEREFYQLIEGRDESGAPNAMCSIVILEPDENDDPTEIASATTMTGAVYLAIVPDGLSMIDVMFDDNTDYDYIQMGGICERYNSLIADANRNGTTIPSLALSISEQGDFSAFMTCVNAAWSYIPTSAEKVCTGIRFIVKTEDIHFLEFDEEQVNKLLDELEDEIISGSIANQNNKYI
jgi:hypothetical protein